MSDDRQTTADNAARFEVRVTSDSHFAWVRTRLALERTIMSWLRTAVALIGFGFAIVRRLRQMVHRAPVRPGPGAGDRRTAPAIVPRVPAAAEAGQLLGRPSDGNANENKGRQLVGQVATVD
jgi:hypothetical protein